jgi:hypothetical protein
MSAFTADPAHSRAEGGEELPWCARHRARIDAGIGGRDPGKPAM